MKSFSEFHFESYDYSAATGALRMRYAYPDGPRFEEILHFPSPKSALDPTAAAALDQAFRLIFLLAGVSYYKAFVPSRLRCLAFKLDEATADFLTRTYEKGLSEFAYRNGLNLQNRIQFEFDSVATTESVELNLERKPLVPIGGGKDSIVTLESLRSAGCPISLFAVGQPSGIAKPILQTAEVANLPLLTVTRELSPNIGALNAGGALNGHVPITAIISSIATACAVMQGFDTIVMSNESSADAPNLRIENLEINHQYSKSLAFERDFAAIVSRNVATNLTYFSLLRSLSEVEIGRRFAALPTYHKVFRSCNTAFRLVESQRRTNWCCDCPKCRFVFLLLAPFLGRQRTVEIFGANLLAEPGQIAGFEELCGLRNHKPFECVGEIEESRLLMAHLSHLPEWKDDQVTRALKDAIDLPSSDLDARIQHPLSRRSPSRIPSVFAGCIDGHF